MPQQEVHFQDLGLIGYKQAWDYQEELMLHNLEAKAIAKKNDLATPDTKNHFLLCEHPPVYTLGRNGNRNNILVSEQQLQEQQIDFYHINRGGDITFHGLGQIVGYPILDLEKFHTDISWYIHNLEEVIIRTIAEFGIKGERSKGATGVWIDPGNPANHQNPGRKICAIGIRCSRWITMHGFALNVNTDLNYFNNIIPCGIADKQVSSISEELGSEVKTNEVREIICYHFQNLFGSFLNEHSRISSDNSLKEKALNTQRL
jgi:lipoyl(octanoyl) transferase